MDKIPDVVDKLFAEEFKRRIIENELTLLERVLKKYGPLPDEVSDKFLNRSGDKGVERDSE